ncbi:MAG TPA: SPOR domain-containing protein [Thermoanaerobaculia bacterium]|nr:SPOR domain-containing protein [Thermoanaerobaculia bacterium]
MTNSHEPSYYEIALTNRQVVVAFVILLICLVSAFFSGLWIGRESTARAQEQLVRNSPPAPAEPQEGQDLEELQFFEDGQPQGDAAEPTAASTPQDTTLLEDLGGEPEDAAIGGDPALPEGRRREGRDAEEETGPDEAPSPTPARPQPTVAPNSSDPRLTSGQKVIQVFSSPELDQAEKVRDRLARGGHKAYLSPVQVSGRAMYRVRIGPFDSREAAQKVAEEVRKSYKLDTWVTE